MVTDEALIAETTVWPNFFLMNIFFALKGSKLFIIISMTFHLTCVHIILVRFRLLSGHLLGNSCPLG